MKSSSMLLVALAICLTNNPFAQAEDTINAVPSQISTFVPIQFTVDHEFVADTYTPPRLPRVGDCLTWEVYQVKDDGKTNIANMRLRYISCERLMKKRRGHE